MNNYMTITEAVARLRSEFDWLHSFIRELYLCSAHCFVEYQNDSGNSRVGDAAGALNVRMLVAAAGNANVSGIDFLCFDVKAFSLQRLDELAFDCQFESEGIRLALGNASVNAEDCWLISKEVQVAFLGKEYFGRSLRLGFELPREDAMNARSLDECWRQCMSCSNAWRESPQVAYSRCPECGQLTKLQS